MIYFTSDTHFGHPGILTHQLKRAAEFSSVEEMDDALIDSINRSVKRKDILYHLGDFCWQASRAGHYRARLNVRELHIIRGNHDAASLRNYVSSCDYMKFLKLKNGLNTIKIHLCHYPIWSWSSMHYDGIHLYGHCHGMSEEKLDALMPNRYSMDVSVDNMYKALGHWEPYPLDLILKILRWGHDS